MNRFDMNKLLITLLVVLPIWLMGNPIPEKILPLSRALKPLSYYHEQVKLWEDTLAIETDHAMGWLNYFTAAKNINQLNGVETYPLGDIATDAADYVPNTFEHWYLDFLASPLGRRHYESLLRAVEIEPHRTEALMDIMGYYEVVNDFAKLKQYSHQLYLSNVIPAGLLEWNYNALMSVERDAILLTQGENDTYPARLLQLELGIRPDVRVVNLDLLAYEKGYIERLFRSLDLPPMDVNVDFPFDDSEKLYELLLHVTKHSKSRIYFGIAIAEKLRKRNAANLYLTGLAFLYSPQSAPNLAMLEENYETKFRKDYLVQPLGTHVGQSVVDKMNLNYVPALVTLFNHYLDKKEKKRAQTVKTLASVIARRAGQEALISRFFSAVEPVRSTLDIDIKYWDKNLMAIPGFSNTYASSTETSNGEYYLFLKDLLRQGKREAFERYAIQPLDWKKLLPGGFGTIKEAKLFDNMHPESDNVPVLNIPFEGAIAYCKWLTDAYNRSRDKNKKFHEVEFYIPTEKEWMIAARGGHKESPYPWGGYYVKNAKGCYLFNGNPYLSKYDSLKQAYIPSDYSESPDADGVYFPAVVASYFPNDYGLYNMAGNAAEMVQEKEFSKGGSWLDPIWYAQIEERHYRETPSPAVGFRVFMKVIK